MKKKGGGYRSFSKPASSCSTAMNLTSMLEPLKCHAIDFSCARECPFTRAG